MHACEKSSVFTPRQNSSVLWKLCGEWTRQSVQWYRGVTRGGHGGLRTPPPPLKISTAVLKSWFYVYQLYSISMQHFRCCDRCRGSICVFWKYLASWALFFLVVNVASRVEIMAAPRSRKRKTDGQLSIRIVLFFFVFQENQVRKRPGVPDRNEEVNKSERKTCLSNTDDADEPVSATGGLEPVSSSVAASGTPNGVGQDYDIQSKKWNSSSVGAVQRWKVLSFSLSLPETQSHDQHPGSPLTIASASSG